MLRGYPPVRTRPVARGLICSALDRFSLAGDCHSPYSLGSLCDGQFGSGRPHLPPVVTRLPCFSPSGSSVGLLGHLLPRITKSSTSMEATWLTVESKVERCGWFGYQPPTAVGLHRRGQSRTPHKVVSGSTSTPLSGRLCVCLRGFSTPPDSLKVMAVRHPEVGTDCPLVD